MNYKEKLIQSIRQNNHFTHGSSLLVDHFFYPPCEDETSEHLLYLNASLHHATLEHPLLEFTGFDSYCLIHTLQGNARLRHDGFDYSLRPDTLVFLDMKKGFRISCSEISSWKFDILFINGANCSYMYQLFYKEKNAGFFLPPISNLPAKIRTLQTLTQSGWEPFSSPLIIHKILTDILTSLLIERNMNPIASNVYPNHIVNVLSYINENYKSPITLDELADTFHISKFTLSHDFKACTGNSLMDTVIQRRIEKTRELLSTTQLSILQIAPLVGFASDIHLIQTFKKRVGLTPLQYRKQHNLHSYTHILNQ